MKLKVHHWGTGDRLAVLVHGGMASAGTWHRVAPLLAERGYRVLAPDLRGHGESAHTATYSPAEIAADLVESLPAGAELALGHSLGGLALSLAVADLRPARAVYSDPAWKLRGNPAADAVLSFARRAGHLSAADIRQMNPRWAESDVRAELAGFAVFDAEGLAVPAEDHVPERPVVPSLVQAADPSWLLPPGLQEDLRARGFEVRVVPGTGHCIHRDDLDGFMKSLDGWI
ncbi:alpha/beta fold hydrolase [Spirillospora sp. NPDC127200]